MREFGPHFIQPESDARAVERRPHLSTRWQARGFWEVVDVWDSRFDFNGGGGMTKDVTEEMLTKLAGHDDA